jgi:hypothetical protein
LIKTAKIICSNEAGYIAMVAESKSNKLRYVNNVRSEMSRTIMDKKREYLEG